MVEAPWGLKETSTPFIVFLAARGDVVSNVFNLWKQRTDLSYRDVGAFDSFAQRAHIVAEYPAGTLLIDDYHQLSPPERAKTQGFNDLLLNLASAASQVGSGVVYASGGFGIMNLTAAAAALIPLALALWWQTASRRD